MVEHKYFSEIVWHITQLIYPHKHSKTVQLIGHESIHSLKKLRPHNDNTTSEHSQWMVGATMQRTAATAVIGSNGGEFYHLTQ